MKPLTRRCPACQGVGRIQVTGVYLGTFFLLRDNPGLNAAQLARKARCKGSAMANRLVALESMGLARGVRHGRQRLWDATG